MSNYFSATCMMHYWVINPSDPMIFSHFSFFIFCHLFSVKSVILSAVGKAHYAQAVSKHRPQKN